MVEPDQKPSWEADTLAGDARAQLRRLLLQDAFLLRGPGQDIVDHRKRPMNWILQSWGVTLSYLGNALVGQCLLQLLASFESTQVAGIAMSGLPLAAAVVQAGRGKYQSLFVRPEREAWGACRHVEGCGDRGKPVVVVDDCICAGSSLKAACAALEADGYEVEGAVALVDFRWKGGVEWARGLGWRVETVFDVWRDLERAEGRGVATWRDVAVEVGAELSGETAQGVRRARTPNGLQPADAARWVAEYWLREGTVPLPPERLEGEHNAQGGVVVSFRDRVSDRRVARDGFYHLPFGWAAAGGLSGVAGSEAEEADLCRDVVLATVKALRAGRGAVEEHGLERLKVGVTMFGPLEPATERQLSFSKYAVAVRSRVFPKLEMALPNTQFFTSEIEQLRHARWTNAKLLPREPHDLFVAQVAKSVEQGCRWPRFGVSDTPEPFEQGWDGDKLVTRAREWVARAAAGVFEGADDHAGQFGVKVGDALEVDGVTVALYDGGLAGCWAVWGGALDTMLRDAAAGAWGDKRWIRRKGVRPEEMDVVVSVLRRAEDLGDVGQERAAFVLRLGKDTLGARHGNKEAILLAYIPCHNNWTKGETARKVLEKAALSSLDKVCWTTYFTRSWLGQRRGGRSWQLDSGFPIRENRQGRGARAELSVIRRMAGYIADKVGEDGLPSYCYYPVSDRELARDSAPRVVLALGALMEAAKVLDDQELGRVALRGLGYCCENISETGEHGARLDLPGIPCGVMAEAFLLNAVYRSGEPALYRAQNVQRLLRRFREFFHEDGAISWLPLGRRIGGEHDLFPGSALYTMAHVAEVEGGGVLQVGLDRQLGFYRRRFRAVPNWGMVFWQTQGWAELERVLGEIPGSAEFVYELMDWALDRQVETGAFLVDYAPDGPGFHTGCVLEALADGWELARQRGEEQRARRYGKAWEQGRKFLDRLIVREEDTFCMRGRGRAVGGVRRSLTSSSMRIDYVAHALLGLVKRFRLGVTVKS